jgi:hypothetical protein
MGPIARGVRTPPSCGEGRRRGSHSARRSVSPSRLLLPSRVEVRVLPLQTLELHGVPRDQADAASARRDADGSGGPGIAHASSLPFRLTGAPARSRRLRRWWQALR